MNKLYKSILIILTIYCIHVPDLSIASEVSTPDVVVSLQIDNPLMKVNGEQVSIDGIYGTKPIVSNGRTLVPIRTVVEAFGGTVEWNDNLRAVTLKLGRTIVRLTINSNIAQLNNTPTFLDVAPTIVNGHTMFPIRFIAESFNWGVAWDDDTQTVFVIRNEFDDNEYQVLKNMIPAYSGKAYVQINDNHPFFKEYELIDDSFEFYGNLDEFGRCDVAMASIGTDLMPTQARKSISSIIPTGWINNNYEFIDGGYLYNRCHLIGFQLTGENANERNLITGTRYLNIEGMLPFENMVDNYIESTNRNVMYRSTPVFSGNNLLADGVLLEAYSVEDGGKGTMFCVYCYNVQPNINIDYSTGANSSIAEELNTDSVSMNECDENSICKIYRTPKGRKYHKDAECGGKNSFEITLQEAISSGLEPCSKCSK